MDLLTDNALQILKSRYLLRDPDGKICETPEQLFRRVAGAVASAELKWSDRKAVDFWSESFFRLMFDLDFLPNSPTLMNAGTEKGQLSACFVLPVEDSLESIFTSLKNAALIHQSGGGTGFNFSRLRPEGDRVTTAGGVSSGPVSFIRIFDFATETVRQGGRRRGANMGILNADHPDIETFISAKADGKKLRNFNLSVGVTDAFLSAVEQDGEWNLINPRTEAITRTLKAKTLWQQLVEQAWQTGDPGLIFFDTVNRYHSVPGLGAVTGMNPCGEMPLLDYESCNLGSINLSRMIKEKDAGIDWEKLETTVKTAIRFLDDVIEINQYILPEIERVTRATRKVGLGVMGWAEMLIRLDIPYASDEAVQLASRLMQFINDRSREVSSELARQRGPFPAWDKSIYYPGQPLRNATRTSIAPTGTISILAGTSSSIEPLYALAFRRVGILDHKSQLELNRVVREKIRAAGFWTDELARQIQETGSVADCPDLPEHLRGLLKTSLEIPWQYHVRHQIAFQQHTDSAVSKTINLPENATRDDIAGAFLTAWKSGAKGITVYRSGSRVGQVLREGGRGRG